MKKLLLKFLYFILALIILFGVYLIANAVYHSGDKDYTTDPTVKM
jgi:hypothetical protein